MAKLMLAMNLDGAAFCDPLTGEPNVQHRDILVNQILCQIGGDIEKYHPDGADINDPNGNRIGRYEITE